KRANSGRSVRRDRRNRVRHGRPCPPSGQAGTVPPAGATDAAPRKPQGGPVTELPLSRPFPRWFLLALALLFLGLGVHHALKVLKGGGAFSRWQPQIVQIDQGVDIAARFNYPNPPIMAVLLEPLARCAPLAGALVWFYLKVGFALVSLHWIFRLVETPGSRSPPGRRSRPPSSPSSRSSMTSPTATSTCSSSSSSSPSWRPC